MYNKEIYNSWELHKDATQLEISYRFFVQLIEVIDVNSLLQYTSDGREIKINDEHIIRKWQEKRINELFNDFNCISTLTFNNNGWYDNSDIFVSTMFKLSQILRTFKRINYKAQQLEDYYEPLLFKLANKYLSFEIMEEWIIDVTSRILDNQNNTLTNNPQFNINWKIVLNDKVKNSVWFLENLCLWFKDIYFWYESKINELKIDSKNEILNNILNHWLIYVLTDFYLKYIYDQNNKERVSFQELYDIVLSLVSKMVKDQTFAIIAFKSIAFFINQLLRFDLIKSNDSIIHNFNLILKIVASNKNRLFLEEIMYEGKESNEFKLLTKEKKLNEYKSTQKKTTNLTVELLNKNKGD